MARWELKFAIFAVLTLSIDCMSVPLTNILKKQPTKACVRSCRETVSYGEKDFDCGFSCIKIEGSMTRSVRAKRSPYPSLPRSWRGDDYIHITPLPKDFKFFDIDGDDAITLPEFARSLGHDPSRKHVQQAFKLSDVDRSGRLEHDEFPNNVLVFEGDEMLQAEGYNLEDTVIDNSREYDESQESRSNGDSGSDDNDDGDSDSSGSRSDDDSNSDDDGDGDSDSSEEERRDRKGDSGSDDDGDGNSDSSDNESRTSSSEESSGSRSSSRSSRGRWVDRDNDGVVDEYVYDDDFPSRERGKEGFDDWGDSNGIFPSGGYGFDDKPELPELDTDMIDSVGDVVDDGVVGTVKDVMDDVAENAADNLGDVVDVDLGDVAENVGDVVENVGEAMGDVVENVADVGSNMVENVAEVAGNVVENVAEVGSNVVENVGEAVGNVAEAAGDVVENVADSNLGLVAAAASMATQAPPAIFPKPSGSLTRGSLATMNRKDSRPSSNLLAPIEAFSLTNTFPESFQAGVPFRATSMKNSGMQSGHNENGVQIPAGLHSKFNIGVNNDAGRQDNAFKHTTAGDSIQWNFSA